LRRCRTARVTKTEVSLVFGIIERDCPEALRVLGYRKDPEAAAAMLAELSMGAGPARAAARRGFRPPVGGV
jgi:hypothetical protein